MTLSPQSRETERVKTKNVKGEMEKKTETQRDRKNQKLEAEMSRTKDRGTEAGEQEELREGGNEAKLQLGVLDARLSHAAVHGSQPCVSNSLFHLSLSWSSPRSPSSKSMFPSHRSGETEAQRRGAAGTHPVHAPCCVSSGQLLTLSGLKFHQRFGGCPGLLGFAAREETRR